MRLINCETLELEEFIGQRIPRYAILSHTWDDEEVTLADYRQNLRSKKGWEKIRQTSALAIETGLRYAWIDTCCIDKSSSAELTEAINSMYTWYANSVVCFAYLSDLDQDLSMYSLGSCRWFTRGWTLQELIAPKEVHFFDQEWKQVGNKADLGKQIAQITGVDDDTLQHLRPLRSISVAHKMSWASQRETTRVEDMAYCLLGLFGVYIPLLYGEEENAFQRLLEEIARSTPDYSIFAWTRQRGHEQEPFSGVLAKSPNDYSKCSHFESISTWTQRSSEIFISNQGVKIRLRLMLKPFSRRRRFKYFLPLCSDEKGVTVGIWLRKCGPDQYVREDPHALKKMSQYEVWDSVVVDRYLLTQLPIAPPEAKEPYHQWLLSRNRTRVVEFRLPNGFNFQYAYPSSRFDDQDQLFFLQEIEGGGRNVVAARIQGCIQTKIGRQNRLHELRFFFFAFIPARDEKVQPQCTIVNYADFDIAQRQIPPLIEQDDQNYVEIFDDLRYSGVQKSRVAIFKYSKTKVTIAVSYTISKKSTEAKNRQEIWIVRFSCRKIMDSEVMSIEEPVSEEWVAPPESLQREEVDQLALV